MMKKIDEIIERVSKEELNKRLHESGWRLVSTYSKTIYEKDDGEMICYIEGDEVNGEK